jgi:hypothetical protein
MEGDRYRLQVSVVLEKVDKDGYVSGMDGRFSTQEQFEFSGIESFTQIAQIMGEFHKLAGELKETIS